MKTVSFLEKLATTAHHRIDINHFLEKQPTQVKEAFLENNALLLKKQFGSENAYLANRTTVVQI